MNWKLILYLIPVIVGGIVVGMFEEGRLAKAKAELQTTQNNLSDCIRKNNSNDKICDELKANSEFSKKSCKKTLDEKDQIIKSRDLDIKNILDKCSPGGTNEKHTDTNINDPLYNDLSQLFMQR